MSLFLQRIGPLVLLAAVAGCSTLNDATDTVKGWVAGSKTLETADKKSSSSPLLKYSATLRVASYIDQRKINKPRYLGKITNPVSGISGNELLMDQAVATLASNAIKKRFDAEGFRIMEGIGANKALFDVSGVVKKLALDIKARDYIFIEIETTVKEVATGKIVWKGIVTEKNNRFAGISGNDKSDVMAYLNKELRIVSAKTVDAISATLMAAHPEMFSLTAGTKRIPGVTVLVAPALPTAAPVVPAMPRNYGVYGDAPKSTYQPHASDVTGLLMVNTNPSRARVYLDGVYYGMSPLRLEIAPGIHAMSVKLSGYKMVSERVSVRRGANTELELNLAQ
ncbi:MAG: PEGA domain-containing protein [Gallionella sp.]